MALTNGVNKRIVSTSHLEDESMKRLAVDIGIFQSFEKVPAIDFGIQVLLVKRTTEPYAGEWSLVGGAVEHRSILKTLEEKMAVKLGFELIESNDFYIEQLCTFDDDDAGISKRDPRNSVVSVAHFGVLRQGVRLELNATSAWFDVVIGRFGKFEIIELKAIDGEAICIYEWHVDKKTYMHREGDELAFDHIRMIHEAFKRIAGKIEYTDLIFKFLTQEFTVRNMQSVMQQFTGVHDPHFRRKFAGWIEETGNELRGLANRPAKLYKRRVIFHDRAE